MQARKLRWGNEAPPVRCGTEHFLVVGATGSGKTTLLNALLKSALDQGAPARSLIYDPKQDVLPYLYAIANNPKRIRVLHPFDVRGCAWDLAVDIDGPLSAQQFAAILVPDEEHSSGGNAFFSQAVRDLLAGVLLTFINCVPKARAWMFRDVLLTLLYQPYLEAILALDTTRTGAPFPYSARLRSAYLEGDPRTIANIRGSINTKLAIFEPVAAVWHRAYKARQRFSLKTWLEDGCFDFLVLGNDEAARAGIDPINQAIFKRATELLLARRELTDLDRELGHQQTWIFLDEVREAGRLDGLGRLLTKGRSKGACVVMGFQDIDGLRSVYGEEVAHEICGQCDNIAVLKLSSPSTAEWAVEVFGRRLTTVRTQSQQRSSDGDRSRGTDVSDQERPYLLSADFIYLPRASGAEGLHGFVRSSRRTPEEGFELELLPDWEKEFSPKPHPLAESDHRYYRYDPRPVAQHYLEPWTDADWKRLGMDRICTLPSYRKTRGGAAVQVNTGPVVLP